MRSPGGPEGADLDALYLTGGSSALRPFQQALRRAFPETELIEGDLFGGVASGLAYAGERVVNYLAGYPEATLAQVRSLIAQERLGEWLLERYPDAHGIRTDKALYDYVMELKNDLPAQFRAP